MKCQYCDQDLTIKDRAGIGYEVWRTYDCGNMVCHILERMPRKERIE